MKSKTGVRPTDSVIWSGKWSANNSSDAGKEREDSQQPKSRQNKNRDQMDRLLFSRMLNEAADQQEDSSQTVDDRSKCKHYLQQMEKSNERIQNRLHADNNRSAPTTLPSTLGLSLNEATGKLRNIFLRVSGVAHEYSANIPEGHVITQTPSPGSRVSSQSGVFLVISKGLPPKESKRKMANFWNMLATKAASAPQPVQSGCDGIKISFSNSVETLSSQKPLPAGVKSR